MHEAWKFFVQHSRLPSPCCVPNRRLLIVLIAKGSHTWFNMTITSLPNSRHPCQTQQREKLCHTRRFLINTLDALNSVEPSSAPPNNHGLVAVIALRSQWSARNAVDEPSSGTRLSLNPRCEDAIFRGVWMDGLDCGQLQHINGMSFINVVLQNLSLIAHRSL